jgi:hypothetical protein
LIATTLINDKGNVPVNGRRCFLKPGYTPSIRLVPPSSAAHICDAAFHLDRLAHAGSLTAPFIQFEAAWRDEWRLW